MKPFSYATALSPESARQLASSSKHGAYLAGGNDLLGLLKEGLVEADLLVNVKALPGLGKIEQSGAGWSIGALATVAQVEKHPGLKAAFPGLAAAAAEVASPQIRNVATVGGNLAQHSRCWYFRHRDTLCLKKGGDHCFARNGENRYHTLFTGNPCVSPMVSSLAVAFAALDAVAVVVREGKELRWSMADFYHRAWENPLTHHSLEPGDLVVRVEVPLLRTRSAYLQASEKHAFDWALVSCAAATGIDGGKMKGPRIALGSISPMPHQAEAANTFLEGKPLALDDATATQAADLLLKEAQPLEHNGYKVPIALALVRRALLQLQS